MGAGLAPQLGSVVDQVVQDVDRTTVTAMRLGGFTCLPRRTVALVGLVALLGWQCGGGGGSWGGGKTLLVGSKLDPQAPLPTPPLAVPPHGKGYSLRTKNPLRVP